MVNKIYLVFNYQLLSNCSDASRARCHATVVYFNRCNNLLNIDTLKAIKTSGGEYARANIIHIAKSRKDAESIAAAWNDNYIKEGRFFNL